MTESSRIGDGSVDDPGPPCPYSWVLIAKNPLSGLFLLFRLTDLNIDAEVSSTYLLTTEENIGAWLSDDTPLVNIRLNITINIRLA